MVDLDADKTLIDYIQFSDLSSMDLRNIVVKDILYLFDRAVARQLIPKMLVIGKFFIYFTSLDSVIADLNIKAIDNSISNTTLDLIRQIWKHKIITVYQNCEKNNCKFNENSAASLNDSVDIYVDPDEFYMSLKCLDPSTKASGTEIASKDGYRIVSLYFLPDEILPEFKVEEPLIT